jgi:aryl-alcohol dehydrogenase-like predicted oxidoreductase
MRYTTLGKSGLEVSDICLGTMLYGEEGPKGTDSKTAKSQIEMYMDLGGNFIDTADIYVDGLSEEIVGDAIKSRRDSLVLATKVRFGGFDEPNGRGLSRRHIVRAVEKSLTRLKTDYIDLYYMHAWDSKTPIEESLRAFEDLVAEGKVRYIGVSNFKAWQLMKALHLSDLNGYSRFIAAQYQYSLVKRDIENEFIDICSNEGLGLVSWGPLGGGFLSGKYTRGEKPQTGRIAITGDETEESWSRRNKQSNWTVLDVVDKIAEKRNVTYAQVAISWLRAKSNHGSVIIGARTLEQFHDNIKAAELDLSAEEVNELDTAYTYPDIYPYGMARRYNF